MSKLNEATVQYGLAKHLEKFGWVYADDETLGRPVDGVFISPTTTGKPFTHNTMS